VTALGDLQRLYDLAELGVLTSGSDAAQARARLTALAGHAAAELRTPTAMVTAVLPGAVAVLAGHGVSGTVGYVQGMPIEWSFCHEVQRTGEPFMITDAMRYPQAADNPLVWTEGLRAYLGVPVTSQYRHVIGALCVTDTVPRIFTQLDLAALGRLAIEAADIIEDSRVRTLLMPPGLRAA
jgi:GAF domain-containing protein